MASVGQGIFIRTTAPLDELTAHLRRFTKVSDPAGKWVFFRYWDPLVAQVYLDVMADHADRIGQMFRLPSGKLIEMVAQTGPAEAVHMRVSDLLPPATTRRPISFGAADMRLLSEVSFRALARQIAAWLGLTMKQDFAFLAQMMMTSGGWSLQDGGLPARHCGAGADDRAWGHRCGGG